jgi:hypothetical protein
VPDLTALARYTSESTTAIAPVISPIAAIASHFIFDSGD